MAMKFTLPSWSAIWKRPRPSLGRLLEISWWVILGLFIALLVLDGAVFYQLGLGRGIESPAGGIAEPELIRVREDAVREAASKIEERMSRFNAAATSSASVPNPFR